MIDRFRKWLSDLVRPPTAPQDFTESRLAESLAAQDAHSQLKAAMSVQTTLLQQLTNITALLTAASVRVANMDAALKKERSDNETRLATLNAEIQRLRDEATSGADTNAQIAALMEAIEKAAKSLATPNETAP